MDDVTAARVEPDRDAPREPFGQLVDELGMFDRRGTDDDAFDAGFEQRDRGVGVTHPTAALHVARDRGADVADDRTVRRATGTGRVEVDDVDPARAGFREALRDRDGVVVVERLAFVVALLQLHDAPVAQSIAGYRSMSCGYGLRRSNTATRVITAPPACA